jgi:dienelactone hydrolase
MKSHAALAILALALSACTSGPQAQAPLRGEDPFPLAVSLPAGVAMREARWYSEQVRVSGRLFLPAGFNAGSNAAAVILAPAWGKTADTLDACAAELASSGIVALSVDYRGWGRSGAELYLGERVDTYDKMRFSEQTPEIVFRRGRLDPEHQVQDLRNAITFIQSEPGIDRARIGVMGLGLGGGHVISVMSMDARAKAGVAVTPDIPGQGEEERSFAPDAAAQAEMIRLARDGAPPRTEGAARARNAQEGRLALAEYKPFWRLDAIPATTAIRFIIAETDDFLDNAVNARAAASELKGPKDLQSIPGALHQLTPAQTATAAKLAAEWFKEKFDAYPR